MTDQLSTNKHIQPNKQTRLINTINPRTKTARPSQRPLPFPPNLTSTTLYPRRYRNILLHQNTSDSCAGFSATALIINRHYIVVGEVNKSPGLMATLVLLSQLVIGPARQSLVPIKRDDSAIFASRNHPRGSRDSGRAINREQIRLWDCTMRVIVVPDEFIGRVALMFRNGVLRGF